MREGQEYICTPFRTVKSKGPFLDLAAIRNSQTISMLPLHQAIKQDNEDEVNRLISLSTTDLHEEDSNGITPLIEACISGNESIVNALLNAGCHAQPSAGFRHSPLRGATVCGHSHLIPILLQAGADPNALSEGKRTPLMGACFLRQGLYDEDEEKKRSEQCVKALLSDLRVDPTIQNSFGESALDLAKIRRYEKSIELLEIALQKWNTDR
ncbi:hypothetical protein HJC23_005939 [Cyclotella cryptica]|uniref:Uncharacterized protein n=1 Tax=Cyclotella cryptica TaxID=29204 RepID=A0ABD3RCW6_9STRA|eukprot:CCRYP_000509-RA/>CCRYP_000509-RA protein AED:0.00 eAED:0.00 QI:5/-1/1/1/-1/1/1/607/210